MVNAPSPLPKLPDHLTETHCTVCNATYADFRAYPSFTEAANRIRARNKESGGGWKSKGPILWEMRVMKMEAWLLAHAECGHVMDDPPGANYQEDPFTYYDAYDGNPF